MKTIRVPNICRLKMFIHLGLLEFHLINDNKLVLRINIKIWLDRIMDSKEGVITKGDNYPILINLSFHDIATLKEKGINYEI